MNTEHNPLPPPPTLRTYTHTHTQVVAQFYANIFFFINAAMFNGLVDQGGDLMLYQHASGTALRANLNLLEGWACQVGFKDAVLRYLAKFSSTVDLLATPAKELLQVYKQGQGYRSGQSGHGLTSILVEI